jgi:Flp pilus assembly protein TadD
MPTLSIVMIVKDEAGRITPCLKSVGGIADEIIVGDTGSTDATAAEARACGARVIPVTWHEDFAEARNSVIAEAAGDWLFHLDADERLDPGGARRLRAVVDADGFGADAIEITVANYCNEPRAWRWVPAAPGDPWARGFSGYIRVELLRLFRNRKGFEYREPVHENITESVRERGGVVRPEPILIHHYGYAAGDAPASAKAERYLAIGRRKVGERPRDPKAWHDLAELLLACGNAQEAEQACRIALSLDPMHIAAATSLANLLLNRGELDEAQGLLQRFDREGNAPTHVVTALGAIACRQGRLEEARRRLETVLAAEPHALMAALYLARTLDILGRPEEARRRLEEAAAIAPTWPEPQDRLAARGLRAKGEELYACGKLQEALAALLEALKHDPEDPLIHNDLGVVLHVQGQTDRARQCFERALRLAPGMPHAQQNLESLSKGKPSPPSG